MRELGRLSARAGGRVGSRAWAHMMRMRVCQRASARARAQRAFAGTGAMPKPVRSRVKLTEAYVPHPKLYKHLGKSTPQGAPYSKLRTKDIPPAKAKKRSLTTKTDRTQKEGAVKGKILSPTTPRVRTAKTAPEVDRLLTALMKEFM